MGWGVKLKVRVYEEKNRGLPGREAIRDGKGMGGPCGSGACVWGANYFTQEPLPRGRSPQPTGWYCVDSMLPQRGTPTDWRQTRVMLRPV